jgi:hypothetical protein
MPLRRKEMVDVWLNLILKYRELTQSKMLKRSEWKSRRSFLKESVSVLALTGLTNSSRATAANEPVLMSQFITEPSAYYELIPAFDSNLCLSVVEGGQDDNMRLRALKAQKKDGQLWKVTYIGKKKFKLSVKQRPDKCLDLAYNGNDPANRQVIYLYNKHDEENQNWYFYAHDNEEVSIRSCMNPEFCCDIDSNVQADGTTKRDFLRLFKYSNNPAQRWKIVRVE